MVINFTTGVIISSISAIPSIISLIIMIKQLIKERTRHLIYLIILFSLGCGWIIMATLANLFLDFNFYYISILITFPYQAFAILFLDSISRETADPIKWGIVLVYATACVILSYMPNTFYIIQYPSGELGIFQQGIFRYVYIIGAIPVAMIWIYYSFMIYHDSPRDLKNKAFLLLFGAIISNLLMPIATIFLSLIIPGFYFLLIGIGNIFITLGIYLEPKTMYILQFTAIRLEVVDTQRGISLFNHVWSKKDDIIDEQLFSGILQVISTVLNEFLHKGVIEEIKLSQAKLIINRSKDYPVATILVSTKSTKHLRNALKIFSEEFYKEYAGFFGKACELNNFKSASSLVQKHFSFVPEYA